MTALTVRQILDLPYVPLLEWKQIPRVPGVYCVIFDRTEVVYVGMTTGSIRSRLRTHHKKQAFLDLGSITIAVVQDGPLAEIEHATIAALAPRFNTHSVPLHERDGRIFRPHMTGRYARIRIIDPLYQAYGHGCEVWS